MILEIQLMDTKARTKESLPDVYHYNYKQFNEPNDNFIISRDRYGNILSFYSDNKWDLTPYALNDYTTVTIDFYNKVKKEQNVKQFKRLIFLLMSLGNESAINKSYSVASLQYCAAMLRKIIIIGEIKNITLFQFLETPKLLKEFIIDRNNTSEIVQINILFKFLHIIDNSVTGVMFKLTKEIEKILSVKYQTILQKTKKQTVIIPTRILANSIAQRWEQIYEIEKHINPICKLIENIIKSKYFASSNKFQSKEYKENANNIFWDDVIKEYGLIKLFKKYNINNKQDFRSFITQLQGTCSQLIHAYTGMRKSEVLSIQENCIQIQNNKYTKIIGITTKLAGFRKEAEWVTAKEIRTVINLLKKLAKVLSIKMKLKNDQKYLFISTSNLTSRAIKNPVIVTRRFEKSALPLDEDSIRIREEDILELEAVEYSRDFRSEEKFQIGKLWDFSTHQYRRSLAVYSIGSGLISISSLQKQFKHLFKEMSLYYQSGSSNLKSILDVHQTHFWNYRKNVEYEINSLSFIKKVLLDPNNTYGAEGTIIKNYVKEYYDNDEIKIWKDRKLTENKMRKGEFVWKETILGGCTQLEPCDDKVTRSLTECITCQSAIHKIESIENTISYQKEFLDSLYVDSIEYKIEKVVYDKLIKYYNSIKEKQ